MRRLEPVQSPSSEGDCGAPLSGGGAREAVLELMGLITEAQSSPRLCRTLQRNQTCSPRVGVGPEGLGQRRGCRLFWPSEGLGLESGETKGKWESWMPHVGEE